ncbi:MAG: polysaccharide biosynthesis protein [Firmicutes bacterium]|nr:polysaccharide biosynthesis protein [Bacillota bacterium]
MIKKMYILLQVTLDLISVNVALAMITYMSVHIIWLSEELYITHIAASIIAVGIFYTNHIYRRLWQFASAHDYLVLIRSILLYVLTYYLYRLFFSLTSISPIEAAILACVTGSLAGGWRLLWRIYGNPQILTPKKQKSKPTLIVGAGGAGTLVAKSLLENRSGLQPIGFIDDDRKIQGMRLMGLPILGTRSDIPKIVDMKKVEEIIIAIPSVSGNEIGEIVELSRNTNARLKILPSVHRIIDGRIPEEQIRDIRVEDLLNRKPVKLNTEIIGGYIKGKVILVTGAGGSVGSELCKQITAYEPGALVLLGRGENSIYQVEVLLSSEFPDLQTFSEIADVRDRLRITQVLAKYKPSVVFHAAAHKHVPLMEKCPDEAFKNNVLGTYNVARAALENKVNTFVLISTDKAVNSTSIMGATKQMAEKVVYEFNGRGETRFVSVRFGNVLGSRGSVIPVFKRQIAAGGPVTVTHPEMVRYFMTVSEAAQLVIEAGAIAKGGEIFVLDMGEPVKIVDLALNMIKLSGYRPEKDIAIEYTGIRPGEKLYEELFGEGESLIKTEQEKIFRAKSATINNNLIDFLSRLTGEQIDAPNALQIINKYTNTFK